MTITGEAKWEAVVRKTTFAVLAAVLGGCATPLATYAPISAAANDVTYEKNVPITVSTRDSSRVAIQPPSGAIASERPMFVIFVANLGIDPVTIGSESVTVRTGEGRELAVIPPEQLQREAQSRANWIRFAGALQAAGNSMSAANAGYSSSSGSYGGSASAYGPGGAAYGTYSGTYTGTQYDAAAAAQAQANANAQNARLAENTNAQAQAVMATSQSGALQRQTIAPGMQFVTPVTIERLPRGTTQIILDVAVGGETHEFQWNYTQQ